MSALRVISERQGNPQPAEGFDVDFEGAHLLQVDGGLTALRLLFEVRRPGAVSPDRVELILEHGVAHGEFESLPVRLATGSVTSSGGTVGALRCPSEMAGLVELALVDDAGRRALVVARRLLVCTVWP